MYKFLWDVIFTVFAETCHPRKLNPRYFLKHNAYGAQGLILNDP